MWYVDIDAAAPPAGQGGRSHSPFNSLAPLTTGGTADGLDGDGDIIFLGVDNARRSPAYDGGIVLETNQRLWGEPFGLTVDPGGADAGTPPQRPRRRHPGNTGDRTTRTSATAPSVASASPWPTASTSNGSTPVSPAPPAPPPASPAPRSPPRRSAPTSSSRATPPASRSPVPPAATSPSPPTINGNTGNAVNVANRSSGTVTFSGDVTGIGRQRRRSPSPATPAPPSPSPAPINLAGSGAGDHDVLGQRRRHDHRQQRRQPDHRLHRHRRQPQRRHHRCRRRHVQHRQQRRRRAANGILLTNVAGPGAFTVNGGAITATTRALDVDDNSGNVTIGATLTTSGAAARSVEVTNRDGGTVDINGLVTDTSQGINLSTNGTGLVRFDGGITASTGANTAFNATGGGTVAVTDTNGATAPNNTLTTTTGTALNVANTTIHADDLTFRSISANGAANGIVLNTTGASGGLTVTGNGGTCTSAATAPAARSRTRPGRASR